VVAPTTTAGGTSRATARAGCRASRNPAPTTARNSPATGDAMVARPACAPARTYRSPRLSITQAASPKATPRAKVVRPEATLHHRAREARSATGSGLGSRARTTRTAASQEPATPASTVTVRTPSPAIRYGETRL